MGKIDFQEAAPAIDFQESPVPSLGDKLSSAWQDFLHPDSNKPEASSVDSGGLAQNLGYLGGVTGTGVADAIKHATVGGDVGPEEWKKALQGNATPVPQALQKQGWNPVASYIAGIPLQLASDPLTSSFAGTRGGEASEFATPAMAAEAPTGGIRNSVADYISRKAEGLAERATGATGKQAQEFLPGTGRRLLDQDIVNFGSSPADIAKNASNSIEEGYAAAPLDQATNTISKQEILDGLDKKIAELSQDESKASVVDQLQRIKENVLSPSVPENRSLVDAEKVKRGFADPQNWENPLAGQAPKSASQVYRDLVEQKANEFSPELGQNYQAAKQNYQALSPVVDASSNRAMQQAQSPIGGLGDIASFMAKGPLGVIAKRAVAPRVASAGAVTLDALSNVIRTSPQTLGKYAGVLSSSAARGNDSLAITNFVLGQSDPKYRELTNHLNNTDDNR